MPFPPLLVVWYSSFQSIQKAMNLKEIWLLECTISLEKITIFPFSPPNLGVPVQFLFFRLLWIWEVALHYYCYWCQEDEQKEVEAEETRKAAEEAGARGADDSKVVDLLSKLTQEEVKNIMTQVFEDMLGGLKVC